jgi:Lon protease-like protein
VLLPLHLFEPRYRQLIRDCMASTQEFGVVLITRGSEVGGGDVRTDVGTVARVLEARELDDGRWAVGAVGTRRIRVVEWLDDDPYPRADVEDWDDVVDGDAGVADAVAPVVATLRRVLALATELGDPAADATHDISADPSLASFQIAALSPVGPMDRQMLLSTPGTTERLARLADLLSEEESFLRRRLELGHPTDLDGP